jgi:hypothetical protein
MEAEISEPMDLHRNESTRIDDTPGMGYITEIKIECIKQDDHLRHDHLEFKVDNTSVGHVSISTGETRDLSGTTLPTGGTEDAPGTTPQIEHAFVDAGQVLSVWVDHLLHSNELLLHHRVRAADLHNGLHATSTATCDCSYVFYFTFDPSASAPHLYRPSNENSPDPAGIFSRLTQGHHH